MDVLETIKQKLRIKPNLNKPEDVFVYVQHKIDTEPTNSDAFKEELDDLVVDYNEDDNEVFVNNNVYNAPVIIDETSVQNFDINNFLNKLRENELLKVVPMDLPKKTKTKLKKKLVIAPAIEDIVLDVAPVLDIQNEEQQNEEQQNEEQQNEEQQNEEQQNEEQQNEEQQNEEQQNEEQQLVPIKKTKQPNVDKEKIGNLPDNDVIIGNYGLSQRMPPNEKQTNIIASSYYMNNRKKFVSFINSIFEPYKRELESLENTITCDSLDQGNDSSKLNLLIHQQIVRDYLNLYTPYRGLLLYHGLGSGKTCSSIAIAEGMKRVQQVVIMTPASLRSNYIEEIKKCGEFIYHRNQYWEWISIDKKTDPNVSQTISAILNLPLDYIKKKKGAWFINTSKPSNYKELSKNDADKKSLEEQLNKMIESKYKFINYNGLNSNKLKEITNNFTINPFDDSVVVIDEAHNLVSRIVNKYKAETPIIENDKGEIDALPNFISTKLYHYLMSAQNAKIVLLTGTPIINYPNEFGILFNILRGYIKTWTFKINIPKNNINKNDKGSITKMLKESENSHDYIEYSPSTNIMTITRNPFGFKNVIDNKSNYQGVSNDIGLGDYVSDEQFQQDIINTLKRNNLFVIESSIKISNKKPLPDKLEDFNNQYINFSSRQIKNPQTIQKRILGLTSYFKSAEEALLPNFDKILGKDYHVLFIPMSDYQFGKYAEMRQLERPKRKPPVANKDLYKEGSSTYRIFSRLICNAAIPNRPFPFKDKIDNLKKKETNENNANAEIEGDEIMDEIGGETYKQQIDDLVANIQDNPEDFLTLEGLEMYSPKFLRLLNIISSPDHQGLHLIYSQFRTIEGITLICEILKFHGYAQFKISKNASGSWFIDIPQEDRGKPTFALYTGREQVDEKEIIRFIYNGEWDKVPDSLVNGLKEIASNNNLGEVIKVFMITSSGSEGINLRNTRYVHIIDPYWHPVRAEQVIGRARRICSHKNLPKELQTVVVFVYIMTFKEAHITGNLNIEINRHDRSKLDTNKVITTDEYLFEISEIKASITKQMTDIIKQSSFDCRIHGNNDCLDIAHNNSYPYSYVPNYIDQPNDQTQKANMVQTRTTFKEIFVNDKKYVYKEDDGYKNEIPIYDINTVKPREDGNPVVPLQLGFVYYENNDYKPKFRAV